MDEPKYDASRPAAEAKLVYNFPLSNSPGMSLLGIYVHFPPNASTPPHTHAGAFLGVHVLQGTLLNKMNDDPMTVKKAGDSFYEAPGCRHRISDNASKMEEAALFASFVMETDKANRILAAEGVRGLVVVDPEYR